MKVVIINKSDSTGGAAVVSRRLLYALRDLGIDAKMLVAEKRLDSPFVELIAKQSAIKRSFLAERLKIFVANGLNRENLFKVDTASDGLPLHRNRLVREADVICLNWVNQGILSVKGLRELLRLGKPIVWTMHDMWNFTGICHHAGSCTRWHSTCGLCPLLGTGASTQDISFKVWNNKNNVYHHRGGKIHFVAVSNWLAGLARTSPLLDDADLTVIPNAFPIPVSMPEHKVKNGKFRILMGAARLDDPVKGLPILVEATRVLAERFPEESKNMELVTFGNIKYPDSTNGIGISHCHLGVIGGEENIRKVYSEGDAIVSTSLYETLPGTLVEGQVYGCIPVSFGRGGQSDIVDHLETGYIAEWNDDMRIAASNITDGLIWAMRHNGEPIREKMFVSARTRFSAPTVASAYLRLFDRLLGRQ